MVQIVLVTLKLTETTYLVDVSDWSWFKIFIPMIVYAGMKYLYGLSDSLSNIFNWLLSVGLVVAFLYLIYYILTL